MRQPSILPTWARRVKPHLIRRLYELDAQGIYDEDLLVEVGWGLHARCQSFLQAMEASRGRAGCPVCEVVILHGGRASEILHCPACGWECTWRDYLKTIRHQQLNGGLEVESLFRVYVEQFPDAHTSPEKMLLIDRLIHGFHHFISSGRTRRPVGVNLIDGDLQFVVEFLDQLSYGPCSTPGVQQTQLQWRENVGRRNSRAK